MNQQRAMPLALCAALIGCREEERKPPTPPPATAEVQVPSKPEPPGESKLLPKRLNDLRRAKGDYSAPTDEQLEVYEKWVSHLTYSIEKERLPARGAPDGFVGTFTEGGKIWLVGEQTGNRGAGALALRLNAKQNVVVQAPHTFFDQGTLPLALTMFDELNARALMLNTVHRAGARGTTAERAKRVRSGEAEQDLAHQEKTYFQTAHRTLVKRWKDAVFVQLHGFRDEQVPGVSVIVSAANTKLDPVPVARALNEMLGAGSARVYPEEVKKLGGTTNVQAQYNKSKDRVFLHLEVSTSMRKRMERQETLRQDFSKAVARALLLD